MEIKKKHTPVTYWSEEDNFDKSTYLNGHVKVMES